MLWQSYEVRWWLPDSRYDLRWTFQIFVTLRPCQDSQTCHISSVRVDINSYFLQQNVLQFTKTLIYLPVAPAIDPQVNEHWILLPGFVENRRHQPKGVNSCCLCNLKLPNSWVTLLSNVVVLCWKWKERWVDHTYFFSQLNCTAKMSNWDEEVLRRKKRILRRNRSLPVVFWRGNWSFAVSVSEGRHSYFAFKSFYHRMYGCCFFSPYLLYLI